MNNSKEVTPVDQSMNLWPETYVEKFIHHLVGGFKHFLFSPRSLGKMNPIWPIFLGSVETTNQSYICWINSGHIQKQTRSKIPEDLRSGTQNPTKKQTMHSCHRIIPGRSPVQDTASLSGFHWWKRITLSWCNNEQPLSWWIIWRSYSSKLETIT